MSTGAIHLADAAATEQAGQALAEALRPGDVVALSGDLGAGKTTFARGVLAALGLEGEAPSPSFALVIAYAADELRLPLWHVDLYRIEEGEELNELGLDDARAEAALLIEWPERMGARLWSDALRLVMVEEQAGGRRLTWDAPPSWEGRWPPAQ
ncbi:tRNA (adenosine(37)-N6)-threonylcarbamoyltransferase complex ATPase subunit type 1 TsaE [Sphingomonas sp.]|uniref:tRNA (adenosine(37)-N6)-threonylcarbamoyltransferase complex ATPase subunit type 1 TsaE n=1 Tax=Sphingomonas sp. TaxID=28214 RepID=UPI003B3A6583